MPRSAVYSTSAIARVLKARLTASQLADILNGLLCCDEDESFTVYEIACGQSLFNAICDLSPEAVEIAATGEPQ